MNPPVTILVPLLILSLAAVLLVLYLLYRDFERHFADFLEFHASLTGSLDDPCLDALRRLTGEGSERPANPRFCFLRRPKFDEVETPFFLMRFSNFGGHPRSPDPKNP